MKVNQILKGVLIIFLLIGTLVGCGREKKGSVDLETLNGYYYDDITNMDYLVDYKAVNIMKIGNGLQGLFENDPQGNIRGGMATSWKVSEDGLTYKFHIRENVSWVTDKGEEYAKVKPTDFIAGMNHALDEKTEYMYLVAKSIKGADDYISGKNKNFDDVGIKADDKNMTLIYNLNQPEPAFISKLLSAVFYPLNSDFLKSKGKSFGKVAPDGILYNGPFIFTQITNKSAIRMKANNSYWDKKNVHLKNINLTFDNKKDPRLQYNSFSKGEASQAWLNAADASFEKILEKQKDNIIYGNKSSSTYFAQFNFDRKSYKNTITGKDKKRTKEAILNHNFRVAIGFALDKAAIIKQFLGKEGGQKAVRNSFIPSNFVRVGEKDYVSILQKELNALDSNWEKVDVEHDGNSTAYNQNLAKQFLEKAKAEGVKCPVNLDWIDTDEPHRINEAKAVKQSIEHSLGKNNVVINLHFMNKEKFGNNTYFAGSPKVLDWDLCSSTGWASDIKDPSGFLNVFDSRSGSMVYLLGIQPSETTEGEYYSGPVSKQIGFSTYNELLDQASEITSLHLLNERNKLFAKAEAQILNERLIIPIKSNLWTQITNIKPYSWASGVCGCSYYQDIFYPFWKYVKLQEKPVTIKQFQEAEKKFEKQSKKAKILGEEK